MRTAEQDERWQRVRIGLTGLAFVFLLVLLGTAISRSSGPADPIDNQAKVKDPEDPMAQIGAAPGSAASNDATPATVKPAHAKP